MNKLVIAYARLSQEDVDKESEFSSSIYNQLGLIKAYAKSIELKVEKDYIDDGFSGTNFERPGFEQLLNDIELGLIDCIIVKDMSRLGRNFLEVAYYIRHYFPQHGVRFISINDQFDSEKKENYENQLMIDFRSVLNDQYAKESSVKRKQIAKSKTGSKEFIGFIAPYGYRIKKVAGKRILEIDEYAANIVKRIFNEIANGKTREEVAIALNYEKIESPIVYMKMTPNKNKNYFYDWSPTIIYRILKNKTYTGRIVERTSLKEDYHKKNRNYIPIRDRNTIDNCHSAIISDELFLSANSKLRTMKRRGKNDYDGLFTNLVICGECGRPMTACRIEKKGREVQYYFECTRTANRKKCPNRSIADSKLRLIVDDTIRNIINNYVEEEEIISDVTKDLLKDKNYNSEISKLKKMIELHSVNIRNLYLRKTKGEIDLNTFLSEKEKDTILKEQYEKQLQKLEETKNIEKRREELQEKYSMFVNDNLVKESVREFISKIDIYKDNTIQIIFKFGLGNPKKIKLF